MNIKLSSQKAVLVFTFMVLPFFAIASSETATAVQNNKNSQLSNNKNRQTQEERVITNEAEYAEALQRQANQSSAVKTSKADQNKSAKSNSALQSSSQSSQASN
ncbi:MAG: hypothetical protein EOO53_11285 [Gammaproteobacteria bacterium]|nr:MAG: hypothetical protein EOO53_11285 [Gammaproteobacteria bacterium]